MEKQRKKGETFEPVTCDGRLIARTFWGKAWGDHLESHSDFSNRLPRGRSYLRNGSVCDLKIGPGKVIARVIGSELYTVEIKIKKLPETRWATIRKSCAGGVASVIELLQGRLSSAVMTIITDRTEGLFPRPAEIEMECSCPDYATMCKHVAATLYGVGARLDSRPELLFVLRGVDHLELIGEAVGSGLAAKAAEPGAGIALTEAELSDVFGIDIAAGTEGPKSKRPAKAGEGKANEKASRITRPGVKGRAFGSPLTRGLKPRASTAEIPPGFAVLSREAKRAGKPGASPSLLRLPNQGGALVAVKEPLRIERNPQLKENEKAKRAQLLKINMAAENKPGKKMSKAVKLQAPEDHDRLAPRKKMKPKTVKPSRPKKRSG